MRVKAATTVGHSKGVGLAYLRHSKGLAYLCHSKGVGLAYGIITRLQSDRLRGTVS